MGSIYIGSVPACNMVLGVMVTVCRQPSLYPFPFLLRPRPTLAICATQLAHQDLPDRPQHRLHSSSPDVPAAAAALTNNHTPALAIPEN